MSEWQPLVLGQCLRHLFDHRGRTPKKLGAAFTPSGVQVISAKLVSGGRLNLDRERRYVSREIYDRWMPVKLAEADVLLTSEAPLGEVAMVPSDGTLCLGQRLFALRTDPSVLDPHFLYYWLRSPSGRSALNERSSGTTVLGIRQAELVKVEVSAPPIRLQRRIGTLLGSIDDLIESNRRRVDLLEEMARVIYREWFVRFRYPGHEGVSLVDSPLGPIPEGWEIRAIGDLASIDKGLSYKGAHLGELGVPMANLKCLRPGGGFRRDGAKPYDGPFKPRHQVSPGDLVMANTDLTQAGTVIGSPAFVPRSGFESGGIASHHLFIIRPMERVARQWLYESFRDDRFRSHARGVASGTTVLGFRPLDLAAYQVPVPPPELANRFDATAKGLADLREDLEELTEILALQRNLLLPKLVIGQIDVSNLDLNALTEAPTA